MKTFHDLNILWEYGCRGGGDKEKKMEVVSDELGSLPELVHKVMRVL